MSKKRIKILSKSMLKRTLVLTGITSTVTVVGLIYIFDNQSLIQQQERANNAIEYAEQINEYNQQLADYANFFDSVTLTDLETIMLVMNDTWNSIDGYQEPKTNIEGYHRLALQEDNVGVCRHIADDMAAKLNAINPEYNARTVAVYTEFGDVTPANVNLKKTEEHIRQQTILETKPKQEEKFMDKMCDIIIGTPNHMVTLVDIKDKDITLVIDPTNGEIGVLIDGKIKMFNDPKGIYDIVYRFNYAYYGREYVQELINEKSESYKYNETYEELESQYGLDAQNEALEKVRNM